MEENKTKKDKEEFKAGVIMIGIAVFAGYLIGVRAGKKIAYEDVHKSIKNNWMRIIDDTTGLVTPLYFNKKDKKQVDWMLDKVNEAFESAEKLKAITKEG